MHHCVSCSCFWINPRDGHCQIRLFSYPPHHRLHQLSPASRLFKPPNAMSHQTNFHHSAPSSLCSMTPAPRVAHDTCSFADHNAAMGKVPGLMTPSLPPPYRAYHEIHDSNNKLPSGHSKNTMKHPRSYAHTKISLAEQSTGNHNLSALKEDVNQQLVHTGKGRPVSKLFRNRKKEDVRKWPPRGMKYLSDPGLPLCQLVPPFDQNFQKLKVNAKMQEEWEELRRIQRRDSQPSSSWKSGKPFQ